MKIFDKRTVTKEYGELYTGDCFQLDGVIYVKTDIAACNVDMYAIRLGDGRSLAIESKAVVIPVEAELTVY